MLHLRKILTSYILGAILLGLAVFLGVKIVTDVLQSQCENSYEFVNTRVVCGPPPVIAKADYAKLQDTLEKFIASKQLQGHITEASVYFRDLRGGPVFGINELDDFSPASLLKLPLAITYLNIAERDPSVLQQKLTVTDMGAQNEQEYQPSQKIQKDKQYSIEELIIAMISRSDNAAYEVLEEYLMSQPQFAGLRKQTFIELGIISPNTQLDETITVRGNASLYRSLYNASYLTPEYSEKLLGWLAQAEFKDGLVAGVPEGVTVAHKFGEREVEGTGVKQLHDCGIIYYPNNPYLLCVMTRGTDTGELARIIGAISKMVYEEVDSRRL